MGEVIPFPKRTATSPETPFLIQLDWTGIEVGPHQCSEHIHYFTSKTDFCQCGLERWPRPERQSE